jgi:glucose-6-phosphate dehydrogenase assembly protein OpcA
MTAQYLPLISLQAPKDVSISEIEAELHKIWQGYNADDGSGLSVATRAATFSIAIYEPEETQQLLARLGFYVGPVDGITGPSTESALKAAQKTYGLPITGKADKETVARLRSQIATNSSTKAATDGQGQSPLDLKGSGVADAIAAANPCRIITLLPIAGEDEGVTAQVSAYCPINKRSHNTLICCEYITLTGTAEALERMEGIVEALQIGELPKFIWWKGTPDPESALFKGLATSATCAIVDSSSFSHPEVDLLQVQTLLSQGIAIADLNWRRLAPWQELTAEAFDPPERRSAVMEVDRVTIDYEKGNPAQALMFLGWLASRLKWQPVSYQEEGGDYDIQRIQFAMPDGRQVEAELAGIPTADWGEIAGDMVGLRLSSTNLQADCCTVLCSENTGCMRMEAGGGAQSCRIQQVTPLTDQKAEFLLSQQLRRWGRDVLYEESLAVTAQIVRLKPTA